jgi:hypothetical protein
MYLAMCADTSMLVGILFYVLLLGALVCAPFIFAFVALLRWADARQKRLAAESPTLR